MINNKIGSNNMDFLLSIVVITYNHEKYIRKCLDSILMQDVDFSFEIIIGDDCSTDKTAQIITEYQDKYPDIIKPNLRSINVGATKNQYDCFLRCTGNYIAILDGDDFWTDKQKLKIQIDFLKNNESFIACTQRYSVVDENDNVTQEVFFGPGRPESGEYTLNDFQKYIYYGHPGTLVFKNIFLEPKHDYSIIHKADRWICDITLGLILTCLGRIYVSDENMTSYRRFQKKGGTNFCSSILGKNGTIERLIFLKKLEDYCLTEMNIIVKHEDRMPHLIWESILYILRYPTTNNWETLKTVYRMSSNKMSVFKYILLQLPMLPILTARQIKKLIIASLS
jgi:glycosyltransferase involved in cell wall biosynthesis